MMNLPTYTKPYTNAQQCVTHLLGKGLGIPAPASAAADIELSGYERLRIYFRSRRRIGTPGKPFEPGITFDVIRQLYECDAILREVCFASVGRFEILLRNAICDALGQAYGSHPYYDEAAFQNASAHLSSLETFMRVYLKSRDQRAKHYKETYGKPALPPVWVLKELLTFGASSGVFKSLNGPLKTSIALKFGVRSDDVFSDWISCLVDLRNICAHHDRLFNRTFQKQPKTLRNAHVPTADRNKLKALLQCLDHLLTARGVPAGIVADVGGIIARYSDVRPAEVGY